ncbi:MAG: S-layer homology domain-containing protein [Oscillospiraceae bacterium]|nr:S-layer homology domain-containing protein [Oscillospiraceae bacterium]
MKEKRVIAALLAASMLVPGQAMAAGPQDFSDFPSDWSTAALDSAVDNGLLRGTNGKIQPQGILTRGELAAIVSRAFGASIEADLSGYGDMSQSAWYYSDMAKAVAMGVLQGSGGKLNPTGAITREEVFVALARAFGLEDGTAGDLSAFSDSGAVSSWAVSGVAALTAGGYVNGADGKLYPKRSITRAEFAQVMYRLVGSYVDQPGSVTKVAEGTVMVRGDGVTLQGVTVTGDLILADGAENVVLDGVTVKGRVLVRSGSGLLEARGSKAEETVVCCPGGAVSLQSADSQLGAVTVKAGKGLRMAGGVFDRLTVQEGAAGLALTVEKDAHLKEVAVYAAGASLSGKGQVDKVSAYADRVAVSTPGTQVVAGAGVNGVTAAGVAVAAGQTGTINASGTGATVTDSSIDDDRPGGGSGTSQTVHQVSSWQSLKAAAKEAAAGDIIRLTSNITDAGSDTNVVDGVSGATLALNKNNLTLDGNGYTITAADGKTFCFDVDGGGAAKNTITVENLTVDGASFSAKLGGGIFVEDGAQASFRRVTVRNSKAGSANSANGGGAIFVNDHGNPPVVTISDCVFENNLVGDGTTGRGGAIYVNNFRSQSPVQVTVTGSTFKGNRAAYGGAIAADGVVALTVKNCTFQGNESAVGADDLYLFDGISQGKKNMTITSQVTAVLSGNTYTNPSDSDSDLKGMNVIFSRYYPAGFAGTPGTAPDGAKDLTFADVERTQLAQTAESIAMQSLEIGGTTYYYGVAAYQTGGWNTSFTVNGAAVKAERIGETNVYYYAEKPLTGMVYGTATLSYGDFYAGDVTTTEHYDAVSSATTKKYQLFPNADTTEPVEGEGYQIKGVKNVPVQVDGQQYAQAKVLEAADGLKGQGVYEKAAAIQLNMEAGTAPAWYKVLSKDGSYGAMQAATAVTVSDAVAELSTSSNWGQYLLTVTETSTKYLRRDREQEWPVGANIQGIIVEAEKDGQTIRVGMEHLQNMWVQVYELGFDVSGEDDNVAATAALEGAVIRKVTYIVPEQVYVFTFADGVYVKPQYQNADLKAAFSADEKYITISGIPAGLEGATVSVYRNLGHGKKAVLVTNAAPDQNGRVALDEGAQVTSNTTYTVQVSSSNYADLSTTVTSADSRLEAPAVEKVVYVDDNMLYDPCYRMSFTGTEEEALRAYLQQETLSVTVDGQKLTKTVPGFSGDRQSFRVADHEQYGYPAYLEFTADCFASAGDHTVVIAAEGYQERSYVYHVDGVETTGTVSGQADVSPFGYNAKVTVTYDKVTGRIVSVTDNGTQPGSNQSFWEKAVGIFESLTGKTASEVDEVDGVSGATVSSKAIKEAVKAAMDNVTLPALADGVWYGTGSWSRYYAARPDSGAIPRGEDKVGPNVVKVTIEQGLIQQVETVKYTDDDNYDWGLAVLKAVPGHQDLSHIKVQLNSKSGEIYDAVSAATETAVGQLSAIENALERARQYTLDGKEQSVAWMELSARPADTVYEGDAMDLKSVSIKLHLTDGSEKICTFEELAGYGVTSDWADGEKVSSDDPRVNGMSFLVNFIQEQGRISIPAPVSIVQKSTYRMPTHIVVTYTNAQTEEIALNENSFRYGLKTSNGIEKMELYDGSEKLADAVFNPDYNEWEFELGSIPAGEGYTGWKFETYFVEVDSSEDQSPVASFTLDYDQIARSYSVGDVLDLSKLEVELQTQQGSNQRLSGWDTMVARGFTAAPANGYTFTEEDVGEKQIRISINGLEQSFTVQVSNYATMIPAKIEIYDAQSGQLLQTVAVDRQAWESNKSWLMIRGVELPNQYKNWNTDTFRVKVYNQSGEALQDYEVSSEWDGTVLKIDFPNYTEYGAHGYVRLILDFVESEPEPTPTETVQGEAEVSFGYTAKVIVEYDPATGRIVSVTDNGTQPGSTNQSFWDKAVGLFESLSGKTASEVDAVDGVSGATVSSNAIKEAVKGALESTAQPVVVTRTSDAYAVGSFGYEVTATVSANDGVISDITWSHNDGGSMSHWTELFTAGATDFFVPSSDWAGEKQLHSWMV